MDTDTGKEIDHYPTPEELYERVEEIVFKKYNVKRATYSRGFNDLRILSKS